LDLRQPTLVIAGAWNPAIFSIEWIATNLWGKKENDVLRIPQVLDIPSGRSVFYHDEIGFLAAPDRICLYCNDFQRSKRAEDIGITLLELLPHTPIVGIGANFMYLEEETDVSIIDMIQTKERLNKFRKIISQQIKTALEIEPDVTLNLERQLLAGNMSFNFNYHYAVFSAASAKEHIRGSIGKFSEDALKLLKDVYDLSGVEYLRHNFNL
jgi:hypothetical protein